MAELCPPLPLPTRFIKIGDKEVEYHHRFRLILHTKYFNPHYKPEMQAQCTLINFLVTRDGLEDQLLAAVVAKERPDLEQLKVTDIRNGPGRACGPRVLLLLGPQPISCPKLSSKLAATALRPGAQSPPKAPKIKECQRIYWAGAGLLSRALVWRV